MEKNEAAWDFAKFFEPLNLDMHGHAGTNSVHVFKICRRADIFMGCHHGKDMEIESMGFEKDAQGPDDAILLTKHFLASPVISQNPILLLPASLVDKLPGRPNTVMPRNWMERTMLKEFRKTAAAIVKEPWCLMEASKYLLEWCAANEARTEYTPWNMQFVFETLKTLPQVPMIAIDWQDFCPNVPDTVTVERLRKRAQGRGAGDATHGNLGSRGGRAAGRGRLDGRGGGRRGRGSASSEPAPCLTVPGPVRESGAAEGLQPGAAEDVVASPEAQPDAATQPQPQSESDIPTGAAASSPPLAAPASAPAVPVPLAAPAPVPAVPVPLAAPAPVAPKAKAGPGKRKRPPLPEGVRFGCPKCDPCFCF